MYDKIVKELLLIAFSCLMFVIFEMIVKGTWKQIKKLRKTKPELVIVD
jgi:hypothetical protein